jgi:hypothetical protein
VALWRHDDGHEREMAKWAHYRLVTARRQAEDAQRLTLTDLDDLGFIDDDGTEHLALRSITAI